jgi:hypothetical protein
MTLRRLAVMKKQEAIAWVSALLIAGFVFFHGPGLGLADEIDPPETPRTSTCCSEAASGPIVRSALAICPGCSVDHVEIANQNYDSETYCICIGRKTITIGPGVTIEEGATIIFSAPKVYIKSVFHAQPGSRVLIETEEPPPPPG